MYRRRIEKVINEVLPFILSHSTCTWKQKLLYTLSQHERFVNSQLFYKRLIFFLCLFSLFLRIFYLLRDKGEASETLHRATFESLHRRRFNLCPAHCQPLTRLRILSVLPSLTSLPLKSSHSHTRLCLKQVNTHILAASRTLTPDWLWIPDKEPSLWISKCCVFEHVDMTHVLVLRGSRQAGWESNHPDAVGATGEQSGQNALSRTWQALPCCHWFYFDRLCSAYFWRCSVMLYLDGSFTDRKKTAW